MPPTMPEAPVPSPQPVRWPRRPSVESWRQEALRTNLWVVPSALSALTILLFVATVSVDRAASAGLLRLPPWVDSGSPDAARQILTSIAAAIITVVGVGEDVRQHDNCALLWRRTSSPSGLEGVPGRLVGWRISGAFESIGFRAGPGCFIAGAAAAGTPSHHAGAG